MTGGGGGSGACLEKKRGAFPAALDYLGSGGPSGFAPQLLHYSGFQFGVIPPTNTEQCRNTQALQRARKNVRKPEPSPRGSTHVGNNNRVPHSVVWGWVIFFPFSLCVFHFDKPKTPLLLFCLLCSQKNISILKSSQFG